MVEEAAIALPLGSWLLGPYDLCITNVDKTFRLPDYVVTARFKHNSREKIK